MNSKLPLDQLSAIIMVANAEEDDLIELFGPFGKRYEIMPAKNNEPAACKRLPTPAFAERLYCRPHLLLVLHRQQLEMLRHDTEMDFVQTIIANDTLEKSVRMSHIRVYGVRRPSTSTWDQCPHCRWQERKRARLHQA